MSFYVIHVGVCCVQCRILALCVVHQVLIFLFVILSIICLSYAIHFLVYCHCVTIRLSCNYRYQRNLLSFECKLFQIDGEDFGNYVLDSWNDYFEYELEKWHLQWSDNWCDAVK